MTVIFGVNLSDRVYLAADSRISDLVIGENGEECVIPRSDNILKVDLVKGNSGVILACAGDAKFASYILKELYKEDFSKQGVVAIRNNIEEWARINAHKYFTEHSYTVANFIFGGSDTKSKKEILARRVLALARAYLKDGMHGQMKHHLAIALEHHADQHGGSTSGLMELPVANTILFSLKISRHGVEIEDTQFGEFLLYGPAGLVKEDLAEQDIGRLEYAKGHGEIRQDMAFIIVLLHELARTKQLDSVGGCVIPLGAFHDGNAYFIDGAVQRLNKMTGQIETINHFFRRNNCFYRVDENGTWRKMTRVVDYVGGGSGRLLI